MEYGLDLDGEMNVKFYEGDGSEKEGAVVGREERDSGGGVGIAIRKFNIDVGLRHDIK